MAKAKAGSRRGSARKRALAAKTWRKTSDGFSLNIHCIQVDVYTDGSGWFLECQALSITHQVLPSSVDNAQLAKLDGLRRVHSKLTLFRSLATEAILATEPAAGGDAEP